MFDAEPPDQEKPQRSLLSLGPAERRPPRGSLLASVPDERADPAALHRLARSRREATPNRLLAALATDDAPASASPPQVKSDPAAPAAPKKGGLAERLAERFSGFFGKTDPVFATQPKPAAPAAEAKSVASAASATPPAAERIAVYRPTIRQPLTEPAPPRREAESRPQEGAANNDQTWRPLIDPTKIIMGVVNSKALIFTATVLGALIGVAIALSSPKHYEAVAELLIDPRDLQLLDRNLTEGGLPSDATLAIVENQVRVITSGTVLNRVVDKLDLTNDPEFNGEREGLGIGTIISGLRSLLSSGGGAGADNRRALAVESLAESLTVERGGKTFVVVISVKTEDADKSALIANTVTTVFLETYGKLQSDTAVRATGELTARLGELQASLDQAERKVETYKAEHDLIDAGGRLISDDEMVKLNEQLSIARAKTIELNAKANSTRSANLDSALRGVLPEEITSNGIVELRAQYASLRREADRLSVKLGPRHPELLAVENELAGLRNEIASELRRIISSVQTELRRAVQLEQELAARLAQLKVRQSGVSEDLVALRELEREAAAKRAVYEAFLLRARQTGEQKDINTANMSVISQAFPPLEPTGPSRAMISLTGMALGFMAGIALGALRGALASLGATMATRRGRNRVDPTIDGGPAANDPAAAEANPPDPIAPPPSGAPSPANQKHEPKPMFSFLEKVLRKPAEPIKAAAVPVSSSNTPATDTPMMQYPYPQPFAAPAQPYAQPPLYPQAAAQPLYTQSAQPMYQQPVQPLYPQAAQYPQSAQPFFGPLPVLAQQAYPASHGYPAPPAYAAPQGYAPAQPPMPVYPQQYAAQQAVYPYPQAVQPPPQMWQPMPAPQPMVYPVQQQPAAVPVYAAPREPEQRYAGPPRAAETDRSRSEIEGVRDSLREFREAIREVSESRARRRAY